MHYTEKMSLVLCAKFPETKYDMVSLAPGFTLFFFFISIQFACVDADLS